MCACFPLFSIGALPPFQYMYQTKGNQEVHCIQNKGRILAWISRFPFRECWECRIAKIDMHVMKGNTSLPYSFLPVDTSLEMAVKEIRPRLSLGFQYGLSSTNPPGSSELIIPNWGRDYWTNVLHTHKRYLSIMQTGRQTLDWLEKGAAKRPSEYGWVSVGTKLLNEIYHLD
jgi:hypothetical protein